MFKTHSSTKHEWGPVAALGKESKDLKYHIRFFTEKGNLIKADVVIPYE